MDKNLQQEMAKGNMVKDPDNWTTGDEAMTGAQKSYLSTLCQEAGEQFDETLSKAEASKRIDELQQMTGRGTETLEKNGSQMHESERSGGRSEIPFIKAEEADETASKREPDDGKVAAG